MNNMINPWAWAGIADKPVPRTAPPEEIIDTICDRWGLLYHAICSKSRRRRIVEARQSAWLTIKTLHPNVTLKTMGDMLGGFDHTTVIHSLRRARNIYDTEPEYKAIIDHLVKDSKGYEYPIDTHSEDIKTVAASAKHGSIRVTRLGS